MNVASCQKIKSVDSSTFSMLSSLQGSMLYLKCQTKSTLNCKKILPTRLKSNYKLIRFNITNKNTNLIKTTQLGIYHCQTTNSQLAIYNVCSRSPTPENCVCTYVEISGYGRFKGFMRFHCPQHMWQLYILCFNPVCLCVYVCTCVICICVWNN